MLFFVTHKGKERRIRIESRANQLYVTFENEPEVPVDLSYFGHDATFLHNGKVFHANIVGDKGEYTVWRPEGNMQFTVESEYRRLVGFLRGQTLEDENNIHAKMPGKITKLHVKVGDLLEKGAPVLVMEAMKMENEVRATMSGIVAKINVGEGQAVESGALLVELKPAE
jgi:acetyl/propionyl-CoA carboxylase alpha subunit